MTPSLDLKQSNVMDETIKEKIEDPIQRRLRRSPLANLLTDWNSKYAKDTIIKSERDGNEFE